MSEVPRKVPVELEDDDYDEVYIVRGNGGKPPRPPPSEYQRPPSLNSDEMRLPFSKWMSNNLKGHFVAAMGEFVGTAMFLFFAFAGTQVANVGGQTNDQSTTNAANGFSPQVLMYIALSFGFSLMVNVWVFFRISGGLFNPAVTLAMAMTRSISVFRAILLVAMQIAGSIFASFIVKVLFPTDFRVRTTLGAGTSLVSGVFIEAILTFELVFTVSNIHSRI
jgi:aquaporin related protein